MRWATSEEAGVVGGPELGVPTRPADAPIKVVVGDGDNAAQGAAVAALMAAGAVEVAIRGAAGNKLLAVANGDADVAVLHAKTCAWDTCAPSPAVVRAGGRVTDYFGAPLSSYAGNNRGNDRGVINRGNDRGVIASSARGAAAHARACAALRSDAAALALLEKRGVRGPSHAADVARDLAGALLDLAAVRAVVGERVESFHAPEAEAFRGTLSTGCRLRLEGVGGAPSSVFLKRVLMKELPAAVKKAAAQPQKLARASAASMLPFDFPQSPDARPRTVGAGARVERPRAQATYHGSVDISISAR